MQHRHHTRLIDLLSSFWPGNVVAGWPVSKLLTALGITVGETPQVFVVSSRGMYRALLERGVPQEIGGLMEACLNWRALPGPQGELLDPAHAAFVGGCGRDFDPTGVALARAALSDWIEGDLVDCAQRAEEAAHADARWKPLRDVARSALAGFDPAGVEEGGSIMQLLEALEDSAPEAVRLGQADAL